jgi:hypothetical protein
MSCTKVMLIRHAEKGDAAAGVQGVNERGAADPLGLSVRGWQRAGALVRALAPLDGHFADPRLAKPSAIFAAAASARHPSTRAADTVQPLAQALGLLPDCRHDSDDAPQALLAAIDACHGPVLVCWRHQDLPALARARAPEAALPPNWPADRYEVIWLFDLRAGAWRFEQLPLRLLPGDGTQGIG